MKWIPLEKVTVDQVARPWLIRRFIDPEAEFIVYDALDAACRRQAASSFQS